MLLFLGQPFGETLAGTGQRGDWLGAGNDRYEVNGLADNIVYDNEGANTLVLSGVDTLDNAA